MIRGKWILEQILGTPPPPPPPDVPPLQEQKQINQTTSVRQRLEQHRSRAECSGCHSKMDPLGFALENFDAVGQYREMDRQTRDLLDTTGQLPDGTQVKGFLCESHATKGARDITQLGSWRKFIQGG